MTLISSFDLLENAFICVLPIEVVRPGLLGEQDVHFSINSCLRILPERACRMDLRRCFAFASLDMR